MLFAQEGKEPSEGVTPFEMIFSCLIWCDKLSSIFYFILEHAYCKQLMKWNMRFTQNPKSWVYLFALILECVYFFNILSDLLALILEVEDLSKTISYSFGLCRRRLITALNHVLISGLRKYLM